MSQSSIRITFLLFAAAVFVEPRAEAQQAPAPPAPQSALPTAAAASGLPRILRLHRSSTITSPLIRLRDVAQPLEPISPWWQRTGGIVVGIMPLDGSEMVIELSRLSAALAADASVPTLQWTGPTSVRVGMSAEPRVSAAVPTTGGSVASQRDPQRDSLATTGRPRPAEISAAAYVAAADRAAPASQVAEPSDPSGQPQAVTRGSALGSEPVVASAADLPALSFQESDRLVRLIQFAIDRNDLSLRESYDIEIDPNQLPLRHLAELRRVDRIEFVRPPAEGLIEVMVHGESSRQPISAAIQLQSTARPLVVVPRDSLRRGHVIASSDVMLQPAPRGVVISSVITRIDDVVDMQVQNVLQKDRPIPSSSITRPILIERGDLVEVRVIGGGITVATSARSLARGAAGDLIAIETLEPRKKVMARVARAGLVEIATRPPRVR